MISGSAGGLRLLAVPGRETRPTLDRIRESVFAILAPKLEGAAALDLFAGTGALGIEALSRGAARCLFVEWQVEALQVLRANLERTRLGERATVRRLRLPQGVRSLSGMAPFDLVLADPPYAFDQWRDLLDQVGALAGPAAVLVCEHGSRTVLEAPSGFQIWRRSEYGQTHVSFFGRGGG